MELMLNLFKIPLYVCGSYPKVAAPHRLSPSDDFEMCMLSLSASFGLTSDLVSIAEEFERGRRSISQFEIGKFIELALSSLIQNVGYKARPDLALISPLMVLESYKVLIRSSSLAEAVHFIDRVLAFSSPEDTVKVLKALKNFGSEISLAIEQCELSERRVIVEGISIKDALIEIARYNKRFLVFEQLHKVIEVNTILKKSLEKARSVNEGFVKTFFLLLKDFENINVDYDKMNLVEVLKLDSSFRKKGYDFSYLLPFIALASIDVVARI